MEGNIKNFLLLTFFPFFVVFNIFKNKNGLLKGFVFAVMSFILTVFFWSIILPANEKQDITITEMKQEIIKKNDNIEKLEKKIKILEKKEPVKKEIHKSIKPTPTQTKNKTKIPVPTKKIITTKSTNKFQKLKEYILTSGNYYSGKDFESGIYNIVAIEGNIGNVISSNMFSGGINAIMGLDKSYAEKEYKNIELPKNVKLEITRIKIKIIRQ